MKALLTFSIVLTCLNAFPQQPATKMHIDSILNTIKIKQDNAKRLKTGFCGSDTTTIRRAKVRELKDSVERQPVDNPLKALEGCIDCGHIIKDSVPKKRIKLKQPVDSSDRVVIWSYCGGLSTNNEPLYVIDGVPQPIGKRVKIDTFDIAEINILKDSVASTTYGSRAANGAVLITTKAYIASRHKPSKFGLSRKKAIIADARTAQEGVAFEKRWISINYPHSDIVDFKMEGAGKYRGGIPSLLYDIYIIKPYGKKKKIKIYFEVMYYHGRL